MSENAVMPMDDYVSACDKVREKLGTEDLIKSGELPEKINEVYEAGQKAEYDSFWDAFQDYGKRGYYPYAFHGGASDCFYGWNDASFKPKYDIIFTDHQQATTSVFEYSPITNIKKSLEDCGVTIDCSKATWLNAPFRYARTEYLPPIDVSSCTDLKMSFYAMTNLKALEIRNLKADCNFDRAITFCYALEHLSITGTIGTGSGGNSSINLQHSTKLTKESLLNVIDCLKDFNETIVDYSITVNNGYSPITDLATEHTLVEGETYEMSWTSTYHYDGGTDTATVGTITLPSGETVKGLKFDLYNIAYDNQTNYQYIYQSGNKLMWYDTMTENTDNGTVVDITVKKVATTTHSIVLGTTNLAKLTDAEKAVATQKGWTLT